MPESFSYVVSFSCECLSEQAGPFSVRATRDSVIEVYRLLPGGDSARVFTGIQSYSIDSLLGRVRRALAESPDTAIVRYDSLYGFPSSVMVDYSFEFADEELVFTVTGFKPAPAKATPVSWVTHKPAKFAYTFMRNCFCFGDGAGPHSVVSARDSVLSVWRRNGTDSVRVTLGVQAYSIDSILAGYARDLAKKPDTAWILYDSTYGYPRQAWVDFVYYMADEEMGFTISGFRVISP